ncbi:hypothetical protein [Symbiopectobacterium purcellii]|uniref:Uncharacterized protein n=1 Tax=Symbiopectobacterium purcellii TaxID=2871826 RepID=A0ABX9ARG7_9ENTR|nr:hypothetical protein [Symbiopectobacterium purcellii]QZN97798.1 hypothetical protein K6K13_11130 [Symbiopectobacterium purcellii]
MIDKVKVCDGNILTLPDEFKRKLFGMLDRPDVSAIRLGRTGKGIQPNYQLVHHDGSVTTIDGSNHLKYTGKDQFIESNLHEALTRNDITRMILSGK